MAYYSNIIKVVYKWKKWFVTRMKQEWAYDTEEEAMAIAKHYSVIDGVPIQVDKEGIKHNEQHYWILRG